MILGWTDDNTGDTAYTAAAVAVKAPSFGLVGTVTEVEGKAADRGHRRGER